MYGLRARRASRPDYNIWCPCGYATSRPPTQIAKGPEFEQVEALSPILTTGSVRSAGWRLRLWCQAWSFARGCPLRKSPLL